MTSIAQYGYQSFIVNQLGVQRSQMNTLTEQISTGLVSQTFGGLGENRSVALNFQTQLDQANSFLPRVSKLTPVISVLLLLLVILIPCAAAAVMRYKRLR